ncbi:hypothetical protein V1511DRAFT_507332 [Dipodascopsis uninucleata]
MLNLPAHVYIRPLGPKDIEQIMHLEMKSVTSTQERTDKSKLIYRLHAAPELCSGMFIRDLKKSSQQGCCFKTKSGGQKEAQNNNEKIKNEKMQSRRHSSSSSSSSASSASSSSSETEDILYDTPVDVKSIPPSCEKMIAVVLATKCSDDCVSEDALDIPETDKYGRVLSCCGGKGHIETGKTLVVHSLVVDPDYSGMKLGTTIMKDFIQRMATQQVADKVAILARDGMIGFFENLGFYDAGPSDVHFSEKGQEWHNLWISLDGEV